MRPREAKPFTRLRGFELCEYSESVIIVRLTIDPMTFLRAIPCPAVSPRRSFSAKMGALANERFDVRTAFLFDEWNRWGSSDMDGKSREAE
jgi:hypothetical protein